MAVTRSILYVLIHLLVDYMLLNVTQTYFFFIFPLISKIVLNVKYLVKHFTVKHFQQNCVHELKLKIFYL